MAPTPHILKRQYGSGGYTATGDGDCYLFCGDATSRYAITAAVIVGILLLIFGARAHAQHRLRTGKPLLLYHKWMVRTTPPQTTELHNRLHGFPPAPGPWGGRHTMPQDHHATDYQLEGWQYPPPPPAYGEANGENNHGEHFAPPMYPPPIYESKGNGGKTSATVTQMDTTVEGSSRASQVEDRERQQAVEDRERQQAEEDRARQDELEYARAHDSMRR